MPFFASVEQAADLKRRGKAITVSAEKRGIIAAATSEALKLGIYTPCPTIRAAFELTTHTPSESRDFWRVDQSVAA